MKRRSGPDADEVEAIIIAEAPKSELRTLAYRYGLSILPQTIDSYRCGPPIVRRTKECDEIYTEDFRWYVESETPEDALNRALGRLCATERLQTGENGISSV